MASHKCEVVELEIVEHENADALEIAKIKGMEYQSIVRKGQFETGDLAVYIPEQSIVPEWVLKELGLWDDEKGQGKLAGKKGDRVKAIRLRGVFSQGLLLPIETWWDDEGEKYYSLHLYYDGTHREFPVILGTDVTDTLGVTKWEPPIPVNMAGEVVNLHGKTLKYDIENVKNYPNIAQALIDLQIPVQITEKLHGTWCCIGIYPEDIHDEIPYGRVVITSKGMSAKGLAFKDNDTNANNLYMRMFKKLFPDYEAFRTLKSVVTYGGPMFFVGEVFGKGVQDLQYGLNDIDFRLFDIYEGKPTQGSYYPAAVVPELVDNCLLPFETVPTLYEGILTWEIINKYTNGLDNITGSHIREGIVIRTLNDEFRNGEIGRVILKSISEDYLERKSGTEYN